MMTNEEISEIATAKTIVDSYYQMSCSHPQSLSEYRVAILETKREMCESSCGEKVPTGNPCTLSDNDLLNRALNGVRGEKGGA